MTESQFIEKNKESWQSLENLLLRKTKDADYLQELFAKVSSDLSYARTFYPNRSVRLYLNNLTLQVFDLISERRKKYKVKDFIYFFTDTLPAEIYNNARLFIISFVIFSLSMLVGVLSSIHNPDFVNVILGDTYIHMTELNINEGDPMAVYKNKDQFDMFMGITINNVKVAFIAFIMGLLGSIGTIFVLISNGIMVGVFQYFFYSKGLFITSFLTIWIHGTFEITAIIIAGASGMILGHGLLFPKTHSRANSLLISTEKALIIILGVVPLFVIAGLLESFVTRMTGLPDIIKIFIIVISLIVVLIMWVFYPLYYGRYKISDSTYSDQLIIPLTRYSNNKATVHTFSRLLAISFVQYRLSLGRYLKLALVPILVLAAIAYYLFLKTQSPNVKAELDNDILFSFNGVGALILFIHCVLISFALSIIGFLYSQQNGNSTKVLPYLKSYYLKIFLIVVPTLIIFYILPFWWFVCLTLILFPHFTIIMIEYVSNINSHSLGTIRNVWDIAWGKYFNFLPSLAMIAAFSGLLFILFKSSLSFLIVEIVNWHNIFTTYSHNLLFITWVFNLTIILFGLPLFYFLVANQFYSEKSMLEALDIKDRFISFGKPKSIFEIS